MSSEAPPIYAVPLSLPLSYSITVSNGADCVCRKRTRAATRCVSPELIRRTSSAPKRNWRPLTASSTLRRQVAQHERTQVQQRARVAAVAAVAGGEAAQLPVAVGIVHEIQVEPVEQEFVPARVVSRIEAD